MAGYNLNTGVTYCDGSGAPSLHLPVVTEQLAVKKEEELVFSV